MIKYKLSDVAKDLNIPGKEFFCNLAGFPWKHIGKNRDRADAAYRH